MNELDFLNNEARIASAFAPEGAQLAVVAKKTMPHLELESFYELM